MIRNLSRFNVLVFPNTIAPFSAMTDTTQSNHTGILTGTTLRFPKAVATYRRNWDEVYAFPPPNDSPVYGFEDSLYQIFHVNEGDELRFEPDDEIESVFDTFHHQVVISLIGAIYSGGTHDHVWESFQRF